ncbi:MAG: hypothetical protein JNN03_24020 [Rubrivivax sp.]|nr:hypothetical protein [Rubrivivax sp.]
MHWELEDNVRAIRQAMRRAHAEGAVLCAFSELALTGFHRRIVEWARPELVGPALAQVQAEAAALGLAVTLGAPTFGAGGERFNSHLFVHGGGLDEGAGEGADERAGERAGEAAGAGTLAGAVAKVGLTAPEATFFQPGAARPRPVVRLALGAGQGTLACSAVICREVEDYEAVVGALAGSGVKLILWPGQMRPDPDKPPQDPPAHVVQAQALARATAAWVVQTNWPNALNRPEESEHTGRSACIAPSGELLFRLPVQGFGLGVFTLGERTFDWYPVALGARDPAGSPSARGAWTG